MTTHRGTCLQWTLTLGVHPGYTVYETWGEEACNRVTMAWQTYLTSERARSGIIVSAVVSRAATVYATDHGCPPCGEEIVFITGSSNPLHDVNHDAYLYALLRVIADMQRHFAQTTVRFTYHTAHTLYIKED